MKAKPGSVDSTVVYIVVMRRKVQYFSSIAFTSKGREDATNFQGHGSGKPQRWNYESIVGSHGFRIIRNCKSLSSDGNTYVTTISKPVKAGAYYDSMLIRANLKFQLSKEPYAVRCPMVLCCCYWSQYLRVRPWY